MVRHPEAAVYVAVEGLRVIGYLSMSQRPQIRLGGRAATIDELVVDEKRRAEGVGTALLDAAITYARGLGCLRVDLSTARARQSYQRGFYVAHGFTEIDSALLRFELVKPRP